MKLNFSLCTLLFLYLTGFSQSAEKVDSSKLLMADTIERISNLNSQDDTAKINEIIAIKLKTEKPVSSFNTLFINGIKVNQLKPWKISEFEKTVFFKLDDEVEQLTTQFLGKSSTNNNIIPVYISVGDSTKETAKASTPIYLILKEKINNKWVWVMGVLLVFLTGLALKKNILKDDNNLYYSLGRTQLFYWTVLFVFCYLFLCLKTDTLPDIPGSVLVILGISVGTTAAAKVIENRNKEGIKLDPTAKSEGLLLDILSDGTSINVHRFQNVVFNLVFGLIFIQRTISTHLIPSFDDNALLLLGISSGAYAGLKITEPTKEQNVSPPQVGTDIPPDKKDEKINVPEKNNEPGNVN
jgi:hypothetical protein